MSYQQELHSAHKERLRRLGMFPSPPVVSVATSVPPPPDVEPVTVAPPPVFQPQPNLRGHVTVRMVQFAVSTSYGITVEDLSSPSRVHKVVVPRHVAMSITRDVCKMSYPEIGRNFGDRDHTTVLNATRRIAAKIVNDPPLAQKIEQIKETLIASCSCKT